MQYFWIPLFKEGQPTAVFCNYLLFGEGRPPLGIFLCPFQRRAAARWFVPLEKGVAACAIFLNSLFKRGTADTWFLWILFFGEGHPPLGVFFVLLSEKGGGLCFLERSSRHSTCDRLLLDITHPAFCWVMGGGRVRWHTGRNIDHPVKKMCKDLYKPEVLYDKKKYMKRKTYLIMNNW